MWPQSINNSAGHQTILRGGPVVYWKSFDITITKHVFWPVFFLMSTQSDVIILYCDKSLPIYFMFIGLVQVQINSVSCVCFYKKY